jgi:hypothetical protein
VRRLVHEHQRERRRERAQLDQDEGVGEDVPVLRRQQGVVHHDRDRGQHRRGVERPRGAGEDGGTQSLVPHGGTGSAGVRCGIRPPVARGDAVVREQIEVVQRVEEVGPVDGLAVLLLVPPRRVPRGGSPVQPPQESGAVRGQHQVGVHVRAADDRVLAVVQKPQRVEPEGTVGQGVRRHGPGAGRRHAGGVASGAGTFATPPQQQ